MFRNTIKDTLAECTLNDFEEYNERYDKGAFRGSEACRYNINAIKKWLSIRDDLTYTENTSGDGWKYIDIIDGWHSKYGTGFIYIQPKKKLWRIKQTSNEFYNHTGEPLE